MSTRPTDAGQDDETRHTTGQVRQRHARISRCTLVVAAALAVAVCSTGRRANSAEKAADAAVVKTREQVAFTVPGRQPKKGTTCTIAMLTKDGRLFDRALPNMVLNARTGEFSWTPTESQAGAFDVTFQVTDAAGKTTRTRRRITVQAGAIAGGNSKLAQRLRAWHAAGSAAGNTGDFYDNRDGGHSKLNARLFPQLDRIEYTDEHKKQRLHWGAQLRILFPHVTVGNSSTSASAAAGGCNTRRCLVSSAAAQMLYKQYRRNHLYVYPEHRDYDPGRNGRGGAYGDLFPANTPYVITSQGSSGSDRVFMEAVVYTLAAFRPDVKKLLTRTGLLMPTVQMIFRRCNTNVPHKQDYLTGAAHRAVFNGRAVNAMAMAEMAHDITLKTIPPMIQLAVVEEDQARPGRDFFDAFAGEKLFDTPAAIARVARSTKHTRRMVVSAERSGDVNGCKLTYHWVVLQGEAQQITIKPLNAESSRVELLVPYHPRRPIAKGAAMQSNRVDIGAFVSNGTYYSAPGFVSIFFLDNEARTYDARGRILEVDYAHGETRIGWHAFASTGGDITDYGAFVEMIASNVKTLPAELLRKQFSARQRRAFQQAAAELRPARAAVKKAETDKSDARKLSAARAALGTILSKHRSELDASVLVRIEDALNAIKNDLNFTFANAKAIDRLYRASKDETRNLACAKARAELRELATELAGEAKRPATAPFASNLPPHADGGVRPCHRSRIEQLNIAILQSIVYPNLLTWRWRPNFVPPRIATPKAWRDVYRYAPDGRLVGWTRYRGNRKEQFTADGALVVKTDPRGRPDEAHGVKYSADRTTKPWTLRQLATSAVFHYAYASDKDLVGRIVNP